MYFFTFETATKQGPNPETEHYIKEKEIVMAVALPLANELTIFNF